MGKEALEQTKITADTEPAKAKPVRDHEQPDKLGTLADTERLKVQSALRVVENSYTWFAKAATQKLGSTLRTDLKKEDL